MQSKDHWESVYSTKATHVVSWFQEHAELSLRLIRATGVSPDGSIIDVGGGASTLVDDLMTAGFHNITVLDLSGAALSAARTRLGPRASTVHWLEADITRVSLPAHAYDVWHDRAVFHFLTMPEDRAAYVRAVQHAVKPGGHVIVATFAEDGPTQCSGLPVMRYSANALHAEFGGSFALLKQDKEAHLTPFGTVQQFVYCYCRKLGL
jgi:2-polyprenyl-3-methyl-5-hydroxy-6-metoxy-1,4-benzoquinol methylase